MCQNSPPSSASSHNSSTEALSQERIPVYTPQEYKEIFLDFYKFLTTLHFDVKYLKIPPPEGWSFSPDFCSELNKSDLVLEVLRHLPFFDEECFSYLDYKCNVVDYLNYATCRLADLRYRDYEGFPSTRVQYPDRADSIDVFCFAEGHQSGGRMLYLNVRDGEVVEDVIRYMTHDPVDVQTFFNELKEDYRSLGVIPCPGRIPMAAGGIDEVSEDKIITQEEVLAQTGDWGTDLDLQYLKQLYRQHGWPDNFQRDAATNAVNELMELMEERRGDSWETGPDYM